MYQFSLKFLNKYDCYTVALHKAYSIQYHVFGQVVAETADKAAEVFFHSNGFENYFEFISTLFPVRPLRITERWHDTAPKRYKYIQSLNKRYAYDKNGSILIAENIVWELVDPYEEFTTSVSILTVSATFKSKTFKESIEDGMHRNCLYFSTEEAREEVLRFLESAIEEGRFNP